MHYLVLAAGMCLAFHPLQYLGPYLTIKYSPSQYLVPNLRLFLVQGCVWRSGVPELGGWAALRLCS